jgi:hypothetical protein
MLRKTFNAFGNTAIQPTEQQKRNLNKCHQMIARSLLELGRFAEAHERAMKSTTTDTDPNSSSLHFVSTSKNKKFSHLTIFFFRKFSYFTKLH